VPIDAPSRFVVLGEALIDLAPCQGENDAYLARPGGSPFNVAVGLARLGQPTALAARLSTDPFGSLLRRHLEHSAVDPRYLLAAPQPSTIALLDLSEGEADYKFSTGGPDFEWSPSDLAFLPDGACAVHFGSLASWLPPGDRAIDAAMSRLKADGAVLVSYDPNVRPQLLTNPRAAREQVERSVALAHVVKASSDDVRYLYRGYDLSTIARTWLHLGAKLVVLTLGAQGSTAWTQSGLILSRPAFRSAVADTVGAGDAFTSGLLDSLARLALLEPERLTVGLDPPKLAALLDAASLVAGLTCSRTGADPPWRAEVDALLRGQYVGQGTAEV
jgi:fructokinase